jgi:hypothetical protein
MIQVTLAAIRTMETTLQLDSCGADSASLLCSWRQGKLRANLGPPGYLLDYLLYDATLLGILMDVVKYYPHLRQTTWPQPVDLMPSIIPSLSLCPAPIRFRSGRESNRTTENGFKLRNRRFCFYLRDSNRHTTDEAPITYRWHMPRYGLLRTALKFSSLPCCLIEVFLIPLVTICVLHRTYPRIYSLQILLPFQGKHVSHPQLFTLAVTHRGHNGDIS